MKNSSNQSGHAEKVTCDLQRVFLYDPGIWRVFFFISVSLSNFSFQPILVLKKDILVWNVKAYGLAIWEWLFGMGVIFAKLLQKQIKFFWGAFNDYMHTILPFSDHLHVDIFTLKVYNKTQKNRVQDRSIKCSYS